jgi:hypothetical protein
LPGGDILLRPFSGHVKPRPEAAAVGERWPTAHGLQQMPVVCACCDICRDDLWFEIELAALKSDGR